MISENNQNTPDYNLMIIKEQIPYVEKIIKDECWLEAERRKQYVPPDDPVIQHKLFEIILRVGFQMRQQAELQLSGKF